MSMPTNVAEVRCFCGSSTLIEAHSRTTWWLVTTMPSPETTTPAPMVVLAAALATGGVGLSPLASAQACCSSRACSPSAPTSASACRQRSGSLKTRSSRRTVAIPAYVAELLRPLVEIGRIDTRLVFATSSGRALDQRNVLRHYDAALVRAGIAPSEHADLEKYRPHDLRHAFATTLLEAGVGEPIVAAWLGHSSTAMLKRYSHVRPTPGGAAYRRLVAVWGEDLELAFGIRSPRRQAVAS